MLSRVLTKYPILKTGRAENGLKLSNGGVSVADWSVENNLVGGSSKDWHQDVQVFDYLVLCIFSFLFVWRARFSTSKTTIFRKLSESKFPHLLLFLGLDLVGMHGWEELLLSGFSKWWHCQDWPDICEKLISLGVSPFKNFRMPSDLRCKGQTLWMQGSNTCSGVYRSRQLSDRCQTCR